MSIDSAEEHRLLGFFAHPDDETIAAGGLLACAVAAGMDVSVVSATRGERGEIIPADLAHLSGDSAGLAAHREQELSAALAELGVRRHLFLDRVPGLEGRRPARFRDSGMVWVSPGVAGPVPDAGADAFSLIDVEVAARLLATLLRHLRPTALLTDEPGGGYGHPDHIQAHRVAMRAVELAADAAPAEPPGGASAKSHDPLDGLSPWQLPTVLWVAQADEDLRDAVEELHRYVAQVRTADGDFGGLEQPADLLDAAGEPLTLPPRGADGPTPSVAVPRREITAALDIAPVAERLIDALAAHRSQIQAVAAVRGHPRLAGHFALSNGILTPLLDRAYVRLAPGYQATAAVAVLTGAADTHRRAVAGAAAASEPTSASPIQRDTETAERAHQEASGGPRRTLSGSDAAGRSPCVARDDGAAEGAAAPAPGGGATAALLSVVAGVVVALLGTAVHRSAIDGWPVGLAVGLVAVLAVAVAARAVAGGGGLLVGGIAVVLTTQAMTFLRPGGDVVVTAQAISYAWLFGAPIMCLITAVLPGRWFASGARPDAETPASAGSLRISDDR